MDYEKAYKEALELMKGCIPDGNGFVNIRPCDIFPELRESEDERIRKALIKGFNECLISSSHYPENAVKYWHGIVIDDILAWLKKQGDKDKLIEELGEYKAKYIQEVLQKHLEEQKPAWSEEGEKIRKALIDFVQQYGDDFYSQVSKGRAIAWLEKQKIDPRQKYLNALLVADNIYQMAMNDEMVAEAESKAIDALMKLCITKYLLGKHGEQKPNPYSGASFDYNGHTWGMCARDNGVEILFDGELKAFLSLEKSFIYPIHSQPELAPKSAKEALFDYENANIQQKDFAPKIEPKFHKGEWVVSKLDRKARQISEVHCDEYNDYYIVEGDEYQIEEYDRLHHLWSIADAKAGDVLSNGKMIVIFKHFEEPSYRQHIVAYIGLDTNGDIQIADDTWNLGIDKAKPATKEQRDLLFQKMEEAGYKWDSEKKELKLLITNGGDFLESENCEQKPAWSEDDERNASYICAALDCYYRLREDRNNTNGQEDLDKARNWLYNKLKSLNPHNRWEPSDEQMDALDSTLQYSQVSHNSFEHLNSLFNDLKKLREK